MGQLAAGLILALAAARCAAAPALLVERPAARVQATLLLALNNIAPGQESRRRYRMALPFGAPLFPSDADLAVPPEAPGLALWRQLPPAERRHDVLIVPDADYYWPAEGRQFSCQFIVHLRSLGAGKVSLEPLQVRPTILLGKKWDLLGRTGPGFYLNIQAAPPSAQANAELLGFLAAALSKPE
ncbi:hypothetical protein AAKU55_000923 [Oxalobacteraceae bacterium GrIS 1.11]